jgi:hypothetical protein
MAGLGYRVMGWVTIESREFRFVTNLSYYPAPCTQYLVSLLFQQVLVAIAFRLAPDSINS